MKTKLLNLVSSRKGKMPSAFSQTEKAGYLPYIDIKLFDKGILSRYAKADKKATLVNKQDVLVVWDGARFGLSALGWEGVLGSTIVALQSDYLISQFLYYFLQLNFETIQAKPRGVGIPHVEPEVFWNLPIPVPPMAEQKRIVKKIEELFGVIDRDIQRLTDTLEQLSQFKKALLQHFFNKLSCDYITLSSVLKTASGGTPSRGNENYYNGSIPWVKSGELTYNTILDTEEHLSKNAIDNSSAKIFPAGSLLIALYGATIGKLAFLGTPAATNQAVCCIFPNANYNLHFLYYYLQLKYDFLINKAKGGAQKNISQEILKHLEIPVPSLPEQQKIVDEIEKAFCSADKVQKTVQNALEEAKKLKQSILKKAFAGELVPQDPNDKPVNLPELKGQTK